MSKILGIDLGTNSIGWAIIDDSTNKIINCGSRIFPNHLDDEKSLVRQKRRQNNRFAQRVLTFFEKSIFSRQANPIILTLFIYSILSGLLTFINYRNWQFWLNSFLTSSIATLTLLHTNNKK